LANAFHCRILEHLSFGAPSWHHWLIMTYYRLDREKTKKTP